MPRIKEVILEETIDKNGTKHQMVRVACSRCGGVGGADIWKETGWTCYKCGGSGVEIEKRKIYTPEHEEKLRKQRERRAEKKRQKLIAEREQTNKKILENLGFHNGKIYIVKGDTYSIKEELKEQGAKFSSDVNGWYFSEPKKNYETWEVDIENLIQYDELGIVSKRPFLEIREYIKSIKNAGKKPSEYVGEVGEKIQIELKHVASFWTESLYGDVCINKLEDADGNIFVWMTGRNIKNDCGDDGKVTLQGMIKEHKEYRGEKQTILTRCRVVK